MESLQSKKSSPSNDIGSIKDSKTKPPIVSLSSGKTKPPIVSLSSSKTKPPVVETINTKTSTLSKKSSVNIKSVATNLGDSSEIGSLSLKSDSSKLPPSPFSEKGNSVEIPANTAPPFSNSVLHSEKTKNTKSKFNDSVKKSSKGIGFGALLISGITATASVMLAVFLYLEAAPYF